jgi:hypothetical protein
MRVALALRLHRRIIVGPAVLNAGKQNVLKNTDRQVQGKSPSNDFNRRDVEEAQALVASLCDLAESSKVGQRQQRRRSKRSIKARTSTLAPRLSFC